MLLPHRPHSPAPLSADPNASWKALRVTDPSSQYVAAVVSTPDCLQPSCPPLDLRRGPLAIHCLITRAYGGKGFVSCPVGSGSDSLLLTGRSDMYSDGQVIRQWH